MSDDKPKNPHAQALGRLGGKARGKPKGFAAATPEQRAAWGRLGGLKSKRTVTKVPDVAQGASQTAAKPLRPPLRKKERITP